MAAATKRMRCERGRISWRCASVAPRGDTYPRPTSGEDRAPLHGGATAEGPIRKWLRWGVRLIRSRSPLSLLVRERRATGASPSAPPVGGQEQGAVGGKKQKTPGARRRLFVNPPTPPHAPARCRAEARCRPGSKREGNTSWKTPGARPGSRDSSDTPTRSGEVSIRGALLPRQQARTKYELGGPRLHPRGAVRAGPTPEYEEQLPRTT